MTRLKFDFRLNTANEHEKGIVKLINELKAERKYVGAVRDGLRLIADLRAGKIDVLVELFPWIVEAFKVQTIETAPPDSGSNIIVLNEIRHLQDLFLQYGTNDKRQDAKSVISSGLKPAGLKPLQGAHALPMPVFDEEDTLVLNRDTHTDASQNFMDAALGIQHGA